MKYRTLVVLLISVILILSAQISAEQNPYNVGKWLPSDQQILETRLKYIAQDIKEDAQLLPEIAEFKEMIESDPEIFMYFNLMFQQIPNEEKFKTDPSGNPVVKDYNEMLYLLNAIMTKAPEFNQTGLVGFPINSILNWSMGTDAGAAVFLNKKVNAQIKKILNK